MFKFFAAGHFVRGLINAIGASHKFMILAKELLSENNFEVGLGSARVGEQASVYPVTPTPAAHGQSGRCPD